MLNNLKIKSLKATGAAYRIADDGGPCKGLGLKVSANGHKSFTLSMRIDGKRKYWKLGDAANTPLSEARTDGLALRKQIERGNDPRDQEVQAHMATLKQLCEGYLDTLKAKDSPCVQEVERIFNSEYKPLHDKIANTVTSPEIADVIRAVVKRGSLGQANRVRAFMQAAFNWGMAADLDCTLEKNGSRYLIKTNPVSPIPKPQKGTRSVDRWLNEAEIKRVWNELPDNSGLVVTNALRLMIATGQRTREVLGIKWTDIEDDVWFMERTKNGKPHEVILNETALSILAEMKEITGECEVVFPQHNARKTPMNSNALSHATLRLCKTKKITHFSPRDLRRTFKSMALKHGMQKDILDKIQNHAQHDVSSKHYVKYAFLKEKREAMIQWNKTLKGILK